MRRKKINVGGKKCNRKKMYAWAQIAGTDFFFSTSRE